MCCRSRRRCGPRRWSTTSPMTMPRRCSAGTAFQHQCAVFPSPWTAGRKLVRDRDQGLRDPARDAAARQSRLPDRHLRFDERAQQAAAGQAVAGDAARPARRQTTASRSSPMPGNAGTALAPTPASEKGRIRAVSRRLGAGGSTAGAEGIRQAYALAERNFDPARRQPRDPRHRRRFQRRHHESRRS